MNDNATILVTVHGSHLYGMNRPDSDLDLFRVVASRKDTLQRVSGGFDYTEMELDTFLTHVFNGSHQSCEALFSPRAYIHESYRPLFRNIRVTGADAFARYRRTIHAFSYGDAKKRRHAVRLGFNLSGLRREGRFDPVLTDDQRAKIMWLSELYRGQSLYDIAINL
jgi:hypothetical protein